MIWPGQRLQPFSMRIWCGCLWENLIYGHISLWGAKISGVEPERPEIQQGQDDSPSGVCLKAAYLMLREMNRSPEPPSIERLASILQNNLNYSYLVGLIEEAYDMCNHGYSFDSFDRDLHDAHGWISDNLHG